MPACLTRRCAAASPRGAAAVLVLGAAAALVPPAARAHCAADEQTLFACPAGTRTLAVCAAPDLDAARGWLQYRYGRAGAVELRLPTERDGAWRARVRGGTLAYSGGGGAYLAFTHPPYRYVVFTASGRGWGHKAGVIVERAGKRIAHRACTGAVTSALGPELFERAGIRLIEEELVLP